VIHIVLAASQEYVNTFSTRRAGAVFAWVLLSSTGPFRLFTLDVRLAHSRLSICVSCILEHVGLSISVSTPIRFLSASSIEVGRSISVSRRLYVHLLRIKRRECSVDSRDSMSVSCSIRVLFYLRTCVSYSVERP